MASRKPVIHGRDHEHGGADPVHIAWEDVGTGGGGTGGPLVSVRRNSAGPTYTRPRINLIEGLNVSMSIGDDSVDGEIDVTVAAQGGGGGGNDPLWAALGFKAITGSPKEYTANISLTSGQIQASAVWIRAGTVITRVGLYMVTAALSVTTYKVGIYNPAFSLLASSANTVTAPANTGWRSAPLPGSGWTCPTSGVYYLAHLLVGSAPLGSYMSNSTGAQGWADLSSSPAAGNPWITWQQSSQTDLTNPATPAAFPDQTPMLFAI